jgi:ribosome biogenesis GTPase
VVCGDEVQCEVDERLGEIHAVAINPRVSCLARANSRGLPEPVVANISRVLVVLAPLPEPDFFIVDRYLAAAASASVVAILVLNKRELEITTGLRSELEAFEATGYQTIKCSARSGDGVDAIVDACRAEVAVLVGQSGTGKSSLLRRLVPESEAATGNLMRDEEGRHTTSASRLYDLPNGGCLIDSPGVRDFAPALESLEPATLGFVEVARRAPQCRFHDCRHMREPDCAVRKAVEIGAMSARRYESYRRMRVLYETLSTVRGPANRPKFS